MESLLFGVYQDYPGVLEDKLCHKEYRSILCKFNPFGTLLATGSSEGIVGIWDMSVRGFRVQWKDHEDTIHYIDWSLLGSRLLTLSSSLICVRDFGTSERFVVKNTFGDIFRSAFFHPLDPNTFIINFLSRSPVIASFVQETFTSDTSVRFSDVLDGSSCLNKTHIAIYDNTGKHIFLAHGDGALFRIAVSSMEAIEIVKPTTNKIYEELYISRCNRYLLGKCSDRIIRLFTLNATCKVEEMKKFQDAVARPRWKRCMLSTDTKLIFGLAETVDSKLYIWETFSSRVIAVLDSPGNRMLEMTWNPEKVQMATTHTDGSISIWSRGTERTRLFSLDFEEIDENEEYDEKEDSFDPVEENNLGTRNKEKTCIDVLSVEENHISKLLMTKRISEKGVVFIPYTYNVTDKIVN